MAESGLTIIDAHLDLAWNALGWNRDLEQNVKEIRQSEDGLSGPGRAVGTVSFPEMRRGRIGLAVATLLARTNRSGRCMNLDFRTREIASAAAQGQIAFYRLLERRGVCRILLDWPALQRSFEEWESGRNDAPLGFILSMEGAEPIFAPEDIAWWYEAGLRIIGPAHYGPNFYAHGTGCEGGLTAAGRELLRRMEEAGMILDLTHLADEGFWEAADRFHGPVLASHNNCRSIVPDQRQFSDEQIGLLLERDAVIGIPLDTWMMKPGWKIGAANNPRVVLEDAIAHIDHICQLAGSCRNVAIGTDLDGGFGREQSPADLDTIADIQNLAPLLTQHGYSPADIAAIFHGNWLRFFKKAWAA